MGTRGRHRGGRGKAPAATKKKKAQEEKVRRYPWKPIAYVLVRVYILATVWALVTDFMYFRRAHLNLMESEVAMINGNTTEAIEMLYKARDLYDYSLVRSGTPAGRSGLAALSRLLRLPFIVTNLAGASAWTRLGTRLRTHPATKKKKRTTSPL